MLCFPYLLVASSKRLFKSLLTPSLMILSFSFEMFDTAMQVVLVLVLVMKQSTLYAHHKSRLSDLSGLPVIRRLEEAITTHASSLMLPDVTNN